MDTKKPTSKKSTSLSTIIFHRPRNNTEESLKNQQAFLVQRKRRLAHAKIIDYTIGKSCELRKLTDAIHLAIQEKSSTLAVIINSPISSAEWDRQYDLYSHLKTIGTEKTIAKLYFMDSEGTLFKRVDDIDY